MKEPRGRIGGREAAGYVSLQARERCRAAALDNIDQITHAHVRDLVGQFLRQGLLDGWTDGLYRHGERNGYSKAVARSRRGEWASDVPVRPGQSLYGRQKAKARRWMAQQRGEFVSRDLAAGVAIGVDLAATYVSRAHADGLLARREAPLQGVAKARHYRWIGQRKIERAA